MNKRPQFPDLPLQRRAAAQRIQIYTTGETTSKQIYRTNKFTSR